MWLFIIRLVICVWIKIVSQSRWANYKHRISWFFFDHIKLSMLIVVKTYIWHSNTFTINTPVDNDVSRIKCSKQFVFVFMVNTINCDTPENTGEIMLNHHVFEWNYTIFFSLIVYKTFWYDLYCVTIIWLF